MSSERGVKNPILFERSELTEFKPNERPRNERSRRSLDRCKDNITGIGYSIGFDTKKTFFTAFKKVKGMTPGEFRANADCLNRQS